MTAGLLLCIRADASSRMGTGHVMRCLALAQWAMQRGAKVSFAGRAGVPWVVEKIRKEGISFTQLVGEPPLREAPAVLLTQLSPAHPGAWVVLDGYHFGPDCQKAVRAAGYKLLVIDDYAHLPEYFCDILLNQNIGAEEFEYTGDVGQKLLGPQYALLRPEFAAARARAVKRGFSEKPRNILLTLGGGDFSDHLARIAPSFTIPELQGCTLRVIAGAMPEERIRKALRDCPATIEILGRVDDMPGLLLDTDLCVTAGGSTCWELCCLGVPFLLVQVAENQKYVTEHLCRSGVSALLSAENLRLLTIGKSRMSCGAKLSSFITGDGADQALDAIEESQYIQNSDPYGECHG